jgi:hypothetical protein
MRMSEPSEVAAALERGAQVQDGPGERLTGYVILGVNFASGDVLALCRFPVSSSGRDYTSVWHCHPSGHQTLYTDAARHGCTDHFGAAVDEIIVAPIRIEWNGTRHVSVAVDGGQRLTWSLRLRSTLLTRLFNAWAPYAVSLLPRHPGGLAPIMSLAGWALRTGPAWRVPTGGGFSGAPWAIWLVQSSRACIAGQDTGPSRPLDHTLMLGDVRVPRRGVFAATHAVLAAGEQP